MWEDFFSRELHDWDGFVWSRFFILLTAACLHGEDSQ